MSYNKSKATSTSSKQTGTERASNASSSSKTSTPSMDKSPSPCLDDLRKHVSGRIVAPIDGYTSHSREDPYQPGGHPGKRAWDLFDHMNNLKDRLQEADARADPAVKAKQKSKSNSK